MDRLGKYEIRGILGRGAMGTVYEAWDPHIARRVAIKTVRQPDTADAEERELLNRFQQEAQAAGRLQHPNIVGVFDYAETDELAYIVMEFVEGRTLKALLDETPTPPPAELGRVMSGLLTGLAYSHSHQVIHRDIKPANIIITPDGAVKIADFGIARIGGSGMTLAGTIMGTPAYMSPEQFKGIPVDPRTDIYSAGVVLYQMLAGKRPFEGNMATIMHAVLNQAVPPPSSSVAAIAPALDAVVAQAMAQAPEARFADAAAFDRALQTALRAPAPLPPGLGDLVDDDATVVRTIRAAPAPPPKPPESPKPPKPAPAKASGSRTPLVAAGLAVLLLAGGGGYFMFGRTPTPQIASHDPEPEHHSTPDPHGKPSDPTNGSDPSHPQTQQHASINPSHPDDGSIQSGPTQGSTDPTLHNPPPPEPVSLATIAATLGQVACTAVQAQDQPGAIRVRGVATANGERMLHDALQKLTPPVTADWQIATAYGPYCDVLDTMRRYVTPDVAVTLQDGRTALVKDNLVVPQIAMPDYPAYLEVDYISNDGGVVHIKQSASGTPYPPGASPVFGRADAKGSTYPVDEPYGTDLVIAVASSAPLFQTTRPQTETIDTYLKDLHAALDQATSSGTRLSANLLLLRTTRR